MVDRKKGISRPIGCAVYLSIASLPRRVRSIVRHSAQGTAGTLNVSPVGYQRLFGEADGPATDAESLMLNQATGAQGVNKAGRYGKKFRSLFDGEHFCAPEIGVICGSLAATRQA